MAGDEFRHVSLAGTARRWCFDSRECVNRDVESDADVAGQTREVGARQSLGYATARTAAGCEWVADRARRSSRIVNDAPAADGSSPGRPTVRFVPSSDGPVGFALENFDGIGTWRELEGGRAIDASGTLPSGESFQGPAEVDERPLTGVGRRSPVVSPKNCSATPSAVVLLRLTAA